MLISRISKLALAPLLYLGLLFGASTIPANAADNGLLAVKICGPDTSNGTQCAIPNSDGTFSVTGSFSATLSGFTPNGNVASLSVTTSTGNVALPAGTVVLVTNTGTTNTAFIKLSVGAGTAAATDMALVAGATVGLTVGSNTFINAITSSSTTTLRMAGGTGLVSGYGGGGGSGGGGAVTIADAADVTLGAKADAKSTATDTTSVTLMQVTKQISASTQLSSTAANQSTEITALGTVNTNLTNVTGTKAAGTAAANSILNGCVYNTSLPTLTNGQQAAAQCDSSGRPLVTVSGAGDASAANQTVVQAVIGAATAPTKMAVAGGVYNSTPLTVTNGQSAALQLDANGYQKVNVAAGNGAAQGAAIAGQTPSTIAAQTLTAVPTAYTTATTNPVTQDSYGYLLTHPYALPSQAVSGITAAMTGTTTTAVTGMGAPGAGLKNHITSVICGNSHATIGTFVDLQDGSGGTIFGTFPAAPAYGGVAIGLPFELVQPTANTALFAVNKTTGANVICTVIGFKAP